MNCGDNIEIRITRVLGSADQVIELDGADETRNRHSSRRVQTSRFETTFPKLTRAYNTTIICICSLV